MWNSDASNKSENYNHLKKVSKYGYKQHTMVVFKATLTTNMISLLSEDCDIFFPMKGENIKASVQTT